MPAADKIGTLEEDIKFGGGGKHPSRKIFSFIPSQNSWDQGLWLVVCAFKILSISDRYFPHIRIYKSTHFCNSIHFVLPVFASGSSLFKVQLCVNLYLLCTAYNCVCMPSCEGLTARKGVCKERNQGPVLSYLMLFDMGKSILNRSCFVTIICCIHF